MHTTNTIVITASVDNNSPSAPGPSNLLYSPALHHVCASYGTIDQWIPLKSFGRVLCVYTSSASAELAKSSLDKVVFGQTRLGVFRVDPTRLKQDSAKTSLLAPPPVVELEYDDEKRSFDDEDELIVAMRHAKLAQNGITVLLDPEEGGADVRVCVQECDDEEESMYSRMTSRVSSSIGTALACRMPRFGLV